MYLAEPTTLVTDWALAAVALVLGNRLQRTATGRAQRLWAAAFLAGAAGALAGGIVHGFAGSLSPVARTVLWKIAQVACGVAASQIFAGLVLATVAGTWRGACLAGAAGQLAAYLASVSGSDDIRYAVWNGALTIVAILALAIATAFHDSCRLALILLALGLSAAGLAAQRAGVAIAILNHNDICHLLQTAALWPFYRAGLRLYDRRRGGPRLEARAGGGESRPSSSASARAS